MWLMLEGKAGAQFSLGSHARSIAVGFVLTLVAPRQDLGKGELHGHLEMGSRSREGEEEIWRGGEKRIIRAGLMLQVKKHRERAKAEQVRNGTET